MSYRLILRSSIKLLLLVVLIGCSFGRAMAQGSSIPTTSAVKEQRATGEDSDELPEGVTHRYPLLNGLSVSLDAFPVVMQVFGNNRANYGGMVTLDLHHRFFPQVAAGVGYCNETNPDNVRYKCSLQPYMKVGMAYNFKYNDLKPNDFYGAFARIGISHNDAEVSNLYYADGFWPMQGPLTLTGLKSTSCWLELGGFIKVQVLDHLSLGWDLSFSPFLSKGNTRNGSPYFVPGYGTTTTALGFAFHVYYDIW